MKYRLFALLALCVALIAASGAQAEGIPDFSGLTLEQLYAARAELNARIDALERQSEAVVYDSGTYQIGPEIPTGDYVIHENEDAVFASVIIRTGSSDNADLVLYHLINSQAVIRLEEGTWLTLSGTRATPIAQVAEALKDVDEFTEGGYLVGAMLPAGAYTAKPDDRAPLSSYSVYGDVLGTGAQLLKFEVLRDPAEISLAAGEYIELSGCTLSRSH